MPRSPSWRRYLRFWRPDIDGDIDEEVRFHLEARTEELVGRGMAPGAARAQAVAEFGDVERVRTGLRAIDRRMLERQERTEWWGALWRDLRLAARSLRRSPGFASVAVITLGLGLGGTAAVFSVVNGVLLEPLPYHRSEELVGVWHTFPGMSVGPISESSDGAYMLYRRSSRVLEDLGAYQRRQVNLTDAARSGEPEHVASAAVTASVFSVLRVQPILGRALTDADDQPGASPVALVSEPLWRRKFGADPALVGRTLYVDGVAREVVGVMPAGVQFPDAGTQLWLPLALDPAKVAGASFTYTTVGRLRPGVSRAAAEAELQRLIPLLPEAFPGPLALTKEMIAQMGIRVAVHPLRDDVVGEIGRVLWIVLGTAAVVLLIACANVANLFLVRAEARQKELAVRTALGAQRGHLLRQFLAETMVLAAMGGALGLALAVGGVRVLQRLAAEGAAVTIPRIAEVGVDGRVLAFAAAVTVLTALLLGALPAIRYGAPDVASVLKASGRALTSGRAAGRTRDALVVGQVALALVLLASSGLLARSFWQLRGVQPGFDPSNTLTLRIALPDAAYPNGVDVARFLGLASDRVTQLPGVRAIGAVSRLPLVAGEESNSPFFVEEFPPAAGTLPPVSELAFATDGYFQAMGIPLVAGRTFERADRERPLDGLIVSRAFAERYWKDPTGQRALGKRVALFAPTAGWYTIIGVVGSVRTVALDGPPAAAVYMPIRRVTGDYFEGMSMVPRTMSILVRTAGDPRRVAAGVRREIRALDATLPVFNVQPMTDVVARSMARTSFTLLLLGVASGVALVLGAVGIYGVISYMVSLRTREIGVRIAVGARPADVSRMVSGRGVVLALVGVGIGLAAALAVTRSLQALLYDVSPADPLTLAGAAALLVAVSFVASWIPARRAARVDPLVAMRADA